MTVGICSGLKGPPCMAETAGFNLLPRATPRSPSRQSPHLIHRTSAAGDDRNKTRDGDGTCNGAHIRRRDTCPCDLGGPTAPDLRLQVLIGLALKQRIIGGNVLHPLKVTHHRVSLVKHRDAIFVEVRRVSAQARVDHTVEADIGQGAARVDLVDTRERNARVVIIKTIAGQKAPIHAPHIEPLRPRPELAYFRLQLPVSLVPHQHGRRPILLRHFVPILEDQGYFRRVGVGQGRKRPEEGLAQIPEPDQPQGSRQEDLWEAGGILARIDRPEVNLRRTIKRASPRCRERGADCERAGGDARERIEALVRPGCAWFRNAGAPALPPGGDCRGLSRVLDGADEDSV